MEAATRILVRACGYQRGQTMTEYALIIAAIAIVAFVGYQALGGNITSLLSAVDSNL